MRKLSLCVWLVLCACASNHTEPLREPVAARIADSPAHAAAAEPAPMVAAAPPTASPLEVHFIDVGTGDCIWIRTGDDGVPGNGRLEGKNIVIDGGDWGLIGRIDGYAFASAYLQGGTTPKLPTSTRIDYLVCTHPHSDHCGGLYGFLQDYDCAVILDPGHDKLADGDIPDRLKPKSAYGRFFQAASAEILSDGTKATFHWGVPDGMLLDVGEELRFEVLASSREILDDDLNNTSIVMRLSFTDPGNGASFLFTGDAEKAVEDSLVQRLGDGLRSTVLKVGHHGSKSSTTEPFLRAVRPQHAVICSGNHKFGGTMLPRAETFQTIETVSAALSLGTTIWRTDRGDKEPELRKVGTEGGDDTVVATTDGQTVTVRYADEAPPVDALPSDQCQATTQAGNRCKRKAKAGSQFCWQHGGD